MPAGALRNVAQTVESRDKVDFPVWLCVDTELNEPCLGLACGKFCVHGLRRSDTLTFFNQT